MSFWKKSSTRKNYLVSISAILVILLVAVLAGCSGTTVTSTAATTTTMTATATTTTTATTVATATATTTATTTATATTTVTPTSTTTAATPTRTPNTKELLLASTTSTRDSGLMDAHNATNFPNWPWDGLIPLFQSKTGYQVKAVYVGTGAAMTQGQQGNADVILVHAPASEVKFVNDGWGINRTLVMHNDFIIVGPANDPAGIKGQTSAVAALKKIADAKANFYSRGDNSGTDQLEKALFAKAGVTVKDGATTNPSWYIEGGAGTGMAALLLIADQKVGYTIADRATYLANTDKLSLKILIEGDTALLNIYHAIEVNPAKFPGLINEAGAKAFIDFLVSPEVQELIGKYGADKYGAPLFFPDAGKTEASLGSQ
jgi:tungstate transport system substrate-binding protein